MTMTLHSNAGTTFISESVTVGPVEVCRPSGTSLLGIWFCCIHVQKLAELMHMRVMSAKIQV